MMHPLVLLLFFAFSDASVFFSRIQEEAFIENEESLPGPFYYLPEVNGNLEKFNLAVLGTCRKVALAVADADLADISLGDEVDLLDKLLLKVLPKCKDAKIIEASLCTQICRSALLSSVLSAEAVQLMVTKTPLAVETEWLASVKDFSFLDWEHALQLFLSPKKTRKPFHLKAFWDTAQAEVVAFLLKKFYFELNSPDELSFCLQWLTKNPAQRTSLEADPSFWFLKRRLFQILVPFPFEEVLGLLEKDFVDAVPLLLAFAHMNSARLTSAMRAIVFAYLDTHKNDHFFDKDSVESFKMFESAVRLPLEEIKEVLVQRKQAILVLESLLQKSDARRDEINQALVLAAYPHDKLTRDSFVVSFDELVANYDDLAVMDIPPEPLLFPNPKYLESVEFWTFLWKQVDVLLDDNLGEMRSFGLSADRTLFSRELLVKWMKLCKTAPGFAESSWTTQFALSIIHAQVKEPYYPLLMDNIKPVFESSYLLPHVLFDLQMRFGHIEEFNELLAAQHFPVLRRFLLDPASLSRAEILFLLHDATCRPILMRHRKAAEQLRTLVDFSGQDLIELTTPPRVTNVVDCNLESFNALHTLRPEAISVFLQKKRAPLILNRPNRFLWSLNPQVLQEDSPLLPALSELIPASVFIQYPKAAMELKLDVAAYSLVDRLSALSLEEKFAAIIKWLINAEWRHFYYDLVASHAPQLKDSEMRGKLRNLETKERVKIIKLLQASSSCDDAKLLARIADLPLAFARMFTFFTEEVDAAMNGTRKGKPEFYGFNKRQSFDEHIERIKENLSRLNELMAKYLTDVDVLQVYSLKLRIVQIHGPVLGEYGEVSMELVHSLYHKKVLPSFDTSVAMTLFKILMFDLESIKDAYEVPPGLPMKVVHSVQQEMKQICERNRNALNFITELLQDKLNRK